MKTLSAILNQIKQQFFVNWPSLNETVEIKIKNGNNAMDWATENIPLYRFCWFLFYYTSLIVHILTVFNQTSNNTRSPDNILSTHSVFIYITLLVLSDKTIFPFTFIIFKYFRILQWDFWYCIVKKIELLPRRTDGIICILMII